MEINYKVLFWIMFVLNVIGLAYLISLVRSVNELLVDFKLKSNKIQETIASESKRVGHAICDLASDIQSHDADMTGKLDLIGVEIEEIAEEILGPIEVGEGDDEEEFTPEPEEEILIEVDEDPIHLITTNQYFFEKGHDKFDLEYDSVSGNLYFYFNAGEEVKHIIIDNVAECIGDGLKYFGIDSRNDAVVYVRNNIFKADFMIMKVA